MASGIGTTGGRRVARGLLLAAGAVLMASCTVNIPLSPALDLPQTGPRIPLTIGVYYSPEFQAHEAVELAGTRESRIVRPL
ncbi:MAG: hypothetical protein V3U60_05765, partial [Gammaproteobacteria bacterium]